MTCIYFGDGKTLSGYICVNDQYRFHVGNRYIWMIWHEYTGPSFYTMRDGQEVYYEAADENDPVWVEFEKWHDERKAKKRGEA
jgi:hypothetical protein